jgi:amidophosphoribosyltransferase
VRAAGAREVHLRISSPPNAWPCYYGIDTPTRSELIASSHSNQEINQYITSDSLAYLSLEGMVEAVAAAHAARNGTNPGSLPVVQQRALTSDSFCHACWSGKYPIEFVPHPRHRQMRLLDT